jgi:hypothetical protein
MDGNTLKEGLNSFYILKLSIGTPYYQGGQHLVKIMLPSAQILLKTSSYLYQDSQLNLSHLFLSWWVRQCRT